MSRLSIRSRVARTTIAASLAIGVTVATGLALAPAAPAASNSFIAVPNGMVGVPETITIKAPNAAGQVVTIGLTLGASAQTMQTTIGSNGFGAVTWTPTGAGTWTINGLGTIASAGSTTATVAAMPTYTVLLAQNNVQQGVSNNVLAGVVAPIGNLAPTGTVYLATTNGNGVGAAPLTGSFGTSTSTATIPWTPNSSGAIPIVATYQPASGGQLTSTSPASQPNSTTADTPVSMRWPATLYVGSPTVLQAVLGAGFPDGSVAFLFDGQGLSPSIPTSNGVATYQWTPPASGIHTIFVSYSGSKPGPNGTTLTYNGTSTQTVNIQPARTADNITVDPPGQPVWSIAQPIVMNVGSTITLVGTSASGTTVLFSEQGPCVIAGAVLTALGAGQCQVTAISPGNATLTPGSETYTVTVQQPPKRPAR